MGKQSVRAVQLGVTDIVAGGRFLAVKKLGEGGCGVIYELMAFDNPKERVACKAELAGNNKEEEILKIESRVIRLLNKAGAKHAPEFIGEGREKNYNFLTMTLLGPSLSDLRKTTEQQKFSLFSSMTIAIQSLDALREIHEIGFLHRDVKPSNFIIGPLGTARERIIYLVDFGLARNFIAKKFDGTMGLRRKRKTAPFRGTVRYCSTNVHAQEEQGRHDDLWSMMYMLVEMILGELPWQNMDRQKTETSKHQEEREILEKCPKEFEIIFQYLKSLNYASAPNYKAIRGLFGRVIRRECHGRRKLDWERGGQHEKTLRKGIMLNEKAKKGDLTLEEILALSDQEEVENIERSAVIRVEGEEEVHATTHSSADDTIEVSQKTQTMTIEKKRTSQAGKYTYKSKDSIHRSVQNSVQKSVQRNA